MGISMKRNYQIYSVIVFGILALFGAFTFLMPQKSYSENENRYLEQLPKITLDKLLSGEFESEFETAVSDQFPGRDAWMKSATVVKQAMGFHDVGDVYLGKDGYLLAKTTQSDIDQKQYLRNLRYVEYFGDCMNGRASTILVPSPGTILQSKLPLNAPYYDAEAMYKEAEAMLKKADHVDVRSELKEYAKQNQVYYHTDHHWTLLGAYAAYSAYSEETQLEKHTYGYFVPKKITEDFKGTMYSKVMPLVTKSDTMYAATNIPKASVFYDGEESTAVYDVEKLTQKDKYGYYFGGNYGQVVIRMKENPEKKLLVVKDSFANCFVPFLMENYDEITMIDLRYYKKSVRKLLQENQYDQALVLYEMSNFAQDTNLYKLVH